MRTPNWLRKELADQGALIKAGDTSDEKAAARLAEQILAKDTPLARFIIGTWVGRKLRPFLADASTGAGSPESQLCLFPDIPRRLEVSPGRFADQAVMTGHDWDAALKQAETKADNASGYAAAIRQAYEKVRPLLTDDELTTADVWKAAA